MKTLQLWPTGVKHADVPDERAFWLWEQLLPADTSATPRVLSTSLWGAVCSPYRPDGHPEGVESGDTSSQTIWPLVSLPPAVIEVAKVLAFTLFPVQSQASHLPVQVVGQSLKASHAYSGNWRFSLMADYPDKPRGAFVRHMRDGKVIASSLYALIEIHSFIQTTFVCTFVTDISVLRVRPTSTPGCRAAELLAYQVRHASH